MEVVCGSLVGDGASEPLDQPQNEQVKPHVGGGGCLGAPAAQRERWHLTLHQSHQACALVVRREAWQRDTRAGAAALTALARATRQRRYDLQALAICG
eukprot:7384930-Prymnesium_polylepis.2